MCVCVCVCVCVAGLVIKTRGKPAAVGSPSKKDGKAANGEEPGGGDEGLENTGAGAERARMHPGLYVQLLPKPGAKCNLKPANLADYRALVQVRQKAWAELVGSFDTESFGATVRAKLKEDAFLTTHT